VAGAIRVPATATPDGKYVFTIAASKGVISVNGKTISKNDEVVNFLRSESEGGKVYVGFTMMALNEAPLSAVTITRFGRSESTATVPDATTPDVSVPDTQSPATTDPDREPADTQEPSFGEDTTTSQPGQEPGQETDPEESREDGTADDPTHDSGNDPDTDIGEDASREPESGASGDTDDRTEDSLEGDETAASDSNDGSEENDTTDELPGGDITKGTLVFFQSINMFDDCSATLGAGSVTVLTVVLSLAAWAFCRKE
jgi:hypothetical protein